MIDWPLFLDISQRQIFWTVLVGIISNSACALLGCFLVLRRMAMLGDALSHAVLPGLVIAFIVTSSTHTIPMFIGAAICAMLTAGLSRLLASSGQTSEESGLGIVFTSFFALGILLIQLYAENVHLDRDIVLEGAIDYVTLETTRLFGLKWPAAFWSTSLVLSGVLLWLGLFWKQIKAASFDPDYASAIGLHGHLMLVVLVVMTALCVVASFKIVGSVLVVAMLVVPAASAQLVCQKLSRMLLASVLFAIFATVVGYGLAWYGNTNAAGMMAVVSGVGYFGALLLSPQQGLIFNQIQQVRLKRQIVSEDILGTIYRWEEAHGLEGNAATAEAIQGDELRDLVGRSFHSAAMKQLINFNLLESLEQDRYRLTREGQEKAQLIIRGHRLWESFLDSEFVLPSDHLHDAAHQMEHYLDQESRSEIEKQLGSPTADPHGRTIPPQ